MRRCGKRYTAPEDAWRSKAGQRPDAEVTDCRAGCGGFHVVKPPMPPRARRRPRVAVQQVSVRRARENRVRKAMIAILYPERPRCVRPGCPRMADDIHEPLTRARGGSITDEGNQKPLCRPCHDEITFKPESELGWAYDIGLLIHSWDAPRGAA